MPCFLLLLPLISSTPFLDHQLLFLRSPAAAAKAAGADLHAGVPHVEGVDHAAEDGDGDGEPSVDEEAHHGPADGESIEEERVDHEPGGADQQVGPVPLLGPPPPGWAAASGIVVVGIGRRELGGGG